MSAIRLGKMPIVMPRRKRYGEHVNDHQVQLVDALAAEQRIIPVHEPEDLEAAVLEARRRTRTALPPPASHMLELVAQAVAEMTGRRP
jgi:UDP-N-acetylglucosamine transferase subunit ALG13